MKNFYKILLALSLLPIFSFGQSFYSGYAISNNGDTLRGYIRFRRWENNPKSIQFKTEARIQPVRLTKNNIRYFSIDLGFPFDFKKYSGPISSDVIDIGNLGTFRDTSYRLDTVFLKILRKGPNVDLFSYDDNLKTRYFIADGPQFAPTELIYRTYYKIDSVGVKSTINEYAYKKQLNYLAVKYGKADNALQSTINSANYTGQNITDIIDKINGYTANNHTINDHLASPPKVKLIIMSAVFVTIAILVFSVMHK